MHCLKGGRAGTGGKREATGVGRRQGLSQLREGVLIQVRHRQGIQQSLEPISPESRCAWPLHSHDSVTHELNMLTNMLNWREKSPQGLILTLSTIGRGGKLRREGRPPAKSTPISCAVPKGQP